jgi:hypothetical protein
MNPLWEKILFLGLGWFLGLSSPLIVDMLKRRREARDVRAALRTELKELQYRMAVVSYMIHIRLGTIDKTLLNWLRPIIASYDGLNAKPSLLTAIDGLLAAPDDQLQSMAKHSKSSVDSALSLKKYPASSFDARSAILLDTKLQTRLSEIRVYLNLFNEEVDQARYYSQQTFNSSISENNLERVRYNHSECQKNAATNAKIIADHIDEIEW